MKAFGLIAIAACGLLSAAAEPQQTYDGRNGPHVFGSPGNQVYIRGQNEGSYSVPGVGGQFQNAPSRGEHVYTDELGNTYVNRKNAGGPATHLISGPTLAAQNVGSNRVDGPSGALDAGVPPRGRRSRQIHIGRPDRTVDIGYGGVYVQRSRRSPQFHVERPDRSVDFGNGEFYVQRSRRSPQDDYDSSFPILIRRRRNPPEADESNIPLIIRRRRGINDARVQGENFVARGDQAGVWNDNVSVWKRPDGRTVSVDKNGVAIVSGRRGTQRYS